jgi:alkanesulfonate monooxygenase SsuD/methylene tetrahydromethanopterin reductase-like flavin-dependent oxidoreductase (luciferase family)
MKVGVYFDLRNPPEWQQDWSRLYGFTLEMCEEAERVGLDSIWLSEHHGFDDGYLSQPLAFAAAVAARTRRVRLGTAVLIAPLHQTAEIAEQAALVDVLSGGRLDLGLGAGYRVPEFELFGADLTKRYTTTDTRARELRKIWTDGRLLPTPVQQHLPIYMGYHGPQGARRAGLLGEGLLSVNPELEEPYQAGLAEGGHEPGAARRAGTLQAWVTDDPERDWPLVGRHLAYQVDSYRRYGVEGTGEPLPRPVDVNRIREHSTTSMPNSFLYGSPDDVAAKVRAYVGELTVESVFFWGSIGGMPEDEVAKGIAAIGRLAPLLGS